MSDLYQAFFLAQKLCQSLSVTENALMISLVSKKIRRRSYGTTIIIKSENPKTWNFAF